MNEPLLSSTEVAALLGVSATSVKRWADEGALQCARTVGKHRRFERSVVERFRAAQTEQPPAGIDPELATWLDLLVYGAPAIEIEARLLRDRAAAGSWFPVAERLGRVLVELGERWSSGQVSILQEHVASERLGRALAHVGDWLPMAPGAPRALLATVENDDHTLGLSLLELCLRELGWSSLWAGRSTPSAEILRTLADHRLGIRLVALSASAASTNERALAHQMRALEDRCRADGIILLVGGAGAWPERPRHGALLRSLTDLPSIVPAR